jgi:phenylacetate-CoA ligase
MTLEVELKQAAQEGLVPAIERSVREVFKLRGSVKILEPGKLADDQKMIEDVRKWD